MAHWRKIVVSGSDARLKSLIVTNNIEAGLGASVASVTASNSAPIELPNISLLPRTYTPLVIDEDGSGTGTGKIFRGAPYAPAVGGEGSSTVGVSGSLPNNIAIIGSGSTFVQTASVLQPVDFNNASIGNIRNLTSSGDISMSNGTLKINTLEAPQQPDFSVLLIDTSTGEVHHTGSYSNTTSYLDLADVPKGIVSSSDQVIAYLSGSGILSSSEQIAQDISGSWQGYISGSGIFSSSPQFSDDFLATNAFTTSSISGSWQGYISGSGSISSSTQITTESDATFADI